MRRIGWMVASLAVVVGCGGGAAPKPATSAEAAKPAAKEKAVEEWKLGKYSTADGMTSMVIDRTKGPKARLQIAGSKDVVELTPEEMRHRTELAGYLFRAPDGTKTLFVGVSGEMLYLKGKDELPLRRDGDAAPLGEPTVKGDPPKPVETKSYAEETAEKLGAIAVVTKNPKLQPKDVVDLKAVAEAFANADASMFVHFVATSSPKAHYAPSSNTTYTTSHAQGELAKGLAKYGGELMTLIDVEPDRKGITLKHWGLQIGVPHAPALADGTPGLVWNVEGTSSIVFVTVDGAPYKVDIWKDQSTVAPGVEASLAKWPAPLATSILGPGELGHLAEANQFDKTQLAAIDKVQETWRTCVQTSFKKLEKDVEALARENVMWHAKGPRYKEMREKWEAKTLKECEGSKPKMEALLTTAIEARNKERLAVLEKAKARATALSLAK